MSLNRDLFLWQKIGQTMRPAIKGGIFGIDFLHFVKEEHPEDYDKYKDLLTNK